LDTLKFKEAGEIEVGSTKTEDKDTTFVKINWNVLESYGKPMPQYKKLLAEIKADQASKSTDYCFNRSSYNAAGRRKYIIFEKLGSIKVGLHAETEIPDFNITYNARIDPSNYKVNAKTKKLVSKYEDLMKDHFQALQDLQALECTLFTLEHDNVRNKAKFVKGLLANSDTGKELVKLMGTVKGSNLVQIGE
jgi:hypothetical protein